MTDLKRLRSQAVAIAAAGGGWLPGLQVSLPGMGRDVSLRILEHQARALRCEAVTRAQDILDAGFYAPRRSTERGETR